MWSRSANFRKPTLGGDTKLEGFATVEIYGAEQKSHLLGDTGLSLPDSARSPSLERWMTTTSLPDPIQRLSQAHSMLSELQGLLRLRVSRATPEDSVWILARAIDALVCILVRDASAESAAQLDADVSFVVAQANRYCCAAALLLFDRRERVDERGAFPAFAASHGEAASENNRLYEIVDTKPRVFYAYLL